MADLQRLRTRLIGRLSVLVGALAVLVVLVMFVADAQSTAKPLVLPPADISVAPEALAAAGPFEQAILEDGIVTFGEYKSANQELAACLRTAGFAVGPVIPALEEDFLHFDVQGGSNAPSIDSYYDCESQFASVVLAVYFIQHVPSGEELARRASALARCLEEAGYDEVASRPTADDFRRIFVTDEDLEPEHLICFGRYQTVLHAISS
jgi:hypothetical protein